MPITDALNHHLKDKSLLKAAAYIGGRWLETAENGTTFEVTNPSTGEVLAVLPNCGVAMRLPARSSSFVMLLPFRATTTTPLAALPATMRTAVPRLFRYALIAGDGPM